VIDPLLLFRPRNARASAKQQARRR
jgi:hypothetical protein